MKILVTGAAGQLGYDIIKELGVRGVAAKGVDIADFDLTQPDAVNAYVEEFKPSHIIHCAAYTAVDKAEQEAHLCRRINADGTRNIARAAANAGAELMYFSTDYVFDGFTKDTPWEADDPKNPQNVYGLTKYEGELAVTETLPEHYILRVSWVFGKNGHNFVRTMLNLAQGRKPLRVVADQIGAPTYTVDLAKLACDMIGSKKYGVYHSPNQGETSWHDFAAEIFAAKGICADLTPVPSSEYKTAAKRPFNSRLSHKTLDDAGFARLPHYSDALRRYLEELDG